MATNNVEQNEIYSRAVGAKLEVHSCGMAALGLSPEWAAEAEKSAELIEKRLARLEQALGLVPLS